jgi:glycine oxidase
MCDVVVIGGGVIGLSIAYELAESGLSVRLLEQGQIGQEASWAGAGILPPGNPDWARTAEARLRAASAQLWPQWAEKLESQTGINTGYVRCGGLEVRVGSPPSELAEEAEGWRAEQVAIEVLSPDDVRERFPGVSADVTAAYYLPDLAQVRNPWLLTALRTACVQHGVELFTGCPVTSLERNGERVHTARTPGGDFSASHFVIAAGAWSRELIQQAGWQLDVQPVRGQIVLLERLPLPFPCVVQSGTRYVVPRRDGRILVGSTEEHVGYDKRNTSAAVSELLAFATSISPELREARFNRAWAGLRPYVNEGRPFIGCIPTLTNVCVATGHYRAGLQLSPITAVLIRQLITGEAVSLPHDCHRYGAHHDRVS